jgi:hypothetical protein
MQGVAGTVSSSARSTFWARPGSFVLTWPLLPGLLLLLLAAGAVALVHHLVARRWAPLHLHRVRGLVP